MIKLIPKKDRDKNLICNARPISLVNGDTKSITKSLASKLKQTLPTIINSDQTAFVLTAILGILKVNCWHFRNFNELKYRGVHRYFRYKKAFDSVSHEFLLLALDYYGFGQNFISWIKLLLLNQERSVFNGGESTGYFKLGRGCRQGDPISAYLFIMVIEIFLL